MRWAAAGLLVLTIVRFWIACVVPLAPDEAYYWTWSRALQAGYLDHPPMVAVWIRIGTALAGDTALGVRLLGPLCAVLGSVLIYDSAARLFPGRRAGLIAAVLLNATLGFGAGAVIMTPDTPLLFFWIVTLWAGARLAAGGTVAWWYVAGFGAGLALLSKYTAVMLPFGLGLWALWARPDDARRAAPWLAMGLMALLFLPVALWNADHAWVSFLKQGGRAGDWRPERAAGFLAELVFGQIGLVTPGIFVLFVMGVAGAVAAVMRRERAGAALAVALTLPGALVFLQHAIGDRVQGNWPAILYPGAAMAAAGCASARGRTWIWPSAAVGFAVTALVYLYAGLGWAALPAARDPVARQLWGWADLAERVEAVRRDAGAGFVAGCIGSDRSRVVVVGAMVSGMVTVLAAGWSEVSALVALVGAVLFAA